MRQYLVGLLLVALGGCSQSAPPASAPGNGTATTPPTAEPQAPTSGNVADPPPVSSGEATPSTIDWSLIKKDPWVSILGNWDQVAEANSVCLQQGSPQAASRCRDLGRMLSFAVTEAQIAEAVGAADAALPALDTVWTESFRQADRRFRFPTVTYVGLAVQSGSVFARRDVSQPACGIQLENATYCPADNSIQFDKVFLAKVLQAVQKANGTMGHYAVAAVAAHEMGHAASIQTGAGRRQTAAGEDWKHREELLADCFSGAAIATIVRRERSASRATQLIRETTPLSEGQVGMLLMGGPEMVDGTHEAGVVRSEYYTRGFNLGVASCAPETFGSSR